MSESSDLLAAQRWDQEYQGGKYDGDGPIPFVQDIVSTLEAEGNIDGRGLYVGCGNGRNYIPLVEAGLKLTGIDISFEGIKQLGERRPEISDGKLICADFMHYQPPGALDYLIAIQVFQHGDRAQAARYFERVTSLLKPGGLFFLRVNSVATDIFHEHAALETSPDGGKTVRYGDGPKQGLAVHFYSKEELDKLAGEGLEVVMPPREVTMSREAPQTGGWVQWEGVWRKTA